MFWADIAADVLTCGGADTVRAVWNLHWTERVARLQVSLMQWSHTWQTEHFVNTLLPGMYTGIDRTIYPHLHEQVSLIPNFPHSFVSIIILFFHIASLYLSTMDRCNIGCAADPDRNISMRIRLSLSHRSGSGSYWIKLRSLVIPYLIVFGARVVFSYCLRSYLWVVPRSSF